jgi:mRNA interferase RelE/StbE
MPRIVLTSGAERDYKKLPPEAQEHIRAIFDSGFAENPFAPKFHIRKLQYPFTGYRLRVGDYRVLFECGANMILVYRVRHRKDAYK